MCWVYIILGSAWVVTAIAYALTGDLQAAKLDMGLALAFLILARLEISDQ